VLRALRMSSAGESGVTPRQFYATHGLKGFFGQGMGPEVTRATTMRVSKFFFNPLVTRTLFGKSPSECSVPEKALAGALATFPEVLAISPFEVAKLGLQVDTKNVYKNSTFAFMKAEYGRRGLAGLYSGWIGMQTRQSIFTGIFFSSVAFYRDFFSEHCGASPTVSRLGGGFCAGVSAALGGNIPTDVVRSVVQKRAFASSLRPVYGVTSPLAGAAEHIQVAVDIVRERGVSGLYRGTLFKSTYLGVGMAGSAVLIPFFSDLMGVRYDMG